MNDLKNLTIWYHYNAEGNIDRIARLMAIPVGTDMDKWFDKYMEPPFKGGGISHIKKEKITVPPHLMNVEGVAYVLYYEGKRFAAVLPYYVTIEED